MNHATAKNKTPKVVKEEEKKVKRRVWNWTRRQRVLCNELSALRFESWCGAASSEIRDLKRRALRSLRAYHTYPALPASPPAPPTPTIITSLSKIKLAGFEGKHRVLNVLCICNLALVLWLNFHALLVKLSALEFGASRVRSFIFYFLFFRIHQSKVLEKACNRLVYISRAF